MEYPVCNVSFIFSLFFMSVLYIGYLDGHYCRCCGRCDCISCGAGLHACVSQEEVRVACLVSVMTNRSYWFMSTAVGNEDVLIIDHVQMRLRF